MDEDENKMHRFFNCSFLDVEALHDGRRDFSKKRKFQDEQVDLPGRKAKFLDPKFLDPENLIGGETSTEKYSSLTESFQGSNSFVSQCDTSIFADVDSHGQADHDQPSTSSCATVNRIDDLIADQCPASRLIKRPCGPHPEEPRCKSVEEVADFITSHEIYEDELNYTEFMCSEYGFGDEGQLSDLTAKEMMLYSNDVAPNSYAFSSGKWATNREAQVGARPPTIDQEFEQYFATLML